MKTNRAIIDLAVAMALVVATTAAAAAVAVYSFAPFHSNIFVGFRCAR